MHGVIAGLLHGRDRIVQQRVQDGHDEQGQRPKEVFAGAQECVGGSQGGVDHGQFQGAEAQQESGPLEEVVAAPAGLYVAQQEMKCEQEEEAAQDLVVDAGPAERLNQAAVEHPENGGAESGGAQTGEARTDRGHQDEVGELGGEDDHAERQRVQAEEAEARHEKSAFAQRADGALRLGRKQRAQKIVEIPDVDAGAQPGKIVAAEPGGEAAPMEQQAEQGGRRPPGRAPRQGHLLSSPTLKTMIPSSRMSAPLGGMALSNWKSTRTESAVRTLAGRSRV